MKMCEYLNNLTKISIISSIIANQKIIEAWATSVDIYNLLGLYHFNIFSSGIGMSAYIKAKPAKSKYACLNIFTFAKDLIFEMAHSKKLQIDNTVQIGFYVVRT